MYLPKRFKEIRIWNHQNISLLILSNFEQILYLYPLTSPENYGVFNNFRGIEVNFDQSH